MKKPITIVIPERNEHVVAYRAAQKKLAELRQLRKSKEAELQQLRENYSRGNAQRARLEAEADKLLAGGAIGNASADQPRDVLHETEIIDLAIAKTQEDLKTLAGRYSRVVCEANKSLYLQIERELLAAVTQLANANAAEQEFWDELQRAGCASIFLRSMQISAIGLPADNQSGVAFWMKEAREFIPEIF